MAIVSAMDEALAEGRSGKDPGQLVDMMIPNAIGHVCS